MKPKISIAWFEQDLRLADNDALQAALKHKHCLAIYIYDDKNAQQWQIGSASRCWLHHSLLSLQASLKQSLNIYRGDAHEIINDLIQRYDIDAIYWNRRYEPWRITRDTNIKSHLNSQVITAKSFSGTLLHEPWQVYKKDHTPYKIFTPYHKEASRLDSVITPNAAPKNIEALLQDPQAIPLASLKLLPKVPWDKHFYQRYTPGEKGAKQALQKFLQTHINEYKESRDFPALESTSYLSPHLHFGEISPQQIMYALQQYPSNDHLEHFKRELRWRDFSYYLLFHFPNLATNNLKNSFDFFPWVKTPSVLKKWQRGLTGYPLVDAGMRELWQTGYMHNRVRMITASFLVKNLLIDWRLGAEWFWDCLLDADLASNSASWQWVAGCGTDAAPYFRIFNPITQGKKFDPNGDYTRQYLPELGRLPNKYLFCPWQAPAEVLATAGVTLGKNYPMPMVDIKDSRQRALDAYSSAKLLAEQCL